MRKTSSILILMAVFVVIFTVGCSTPAAPATQAAAPEVQQPVVVPADTQSLPEPAVQGFAPTCQSQASCIAPAIPDVDSVNTYCVKKIPYQNISLPSGTTYESLDSKGELNCYDSGTVVDGNNIITCTGKQLWTYELKLTNTACAGGSNLQAGTTSCADGEGYDAASNCCSPMSAGDSSSVIIKVNIGACP